MDKNKVFEYTVNQQHLHNCQLRLNGVRVAANLDESLASELSRLLLAEQDILSRMTSEEIALQIAHETREPTVAERRAQDRADRAAALENRDKPSI